MDNRGITVDRKLRINHQIRVPQVRLVDFDGSLIGVKTINEALALAQERGLDLIEIAPAATPPVCKVDDFTKFRYEMDKKAKEAKKKQKIVHLKEIRVRLKIGEHDLAIKIKHAREFLEKKDKVQISVIFMGREMQHRELGTALIEKIKASLLDIAVVERSPLMFGTRLIMHLAPKK
ncbi:MAG: translation initiation factor IF-3 [Endomicrobiales bacterium]|nr:translation initiation factor IF-3 [Endomicrobiales bacterium]